MRLLNFDDFVPVKTGYEFFAGVSPRVAQYSGAGNQIIGPAMDMAMKPGGNVEFMHQRLEVIAIRQLFKLVRRFIPAPLRRRVMSHHDRFSCKWFGQRLFQPVFRLMEHPAVIVDIYQSAVVSDLPEIIQRFA